MGSDFTDDPYLLKPRKARLSPGHDEENIRHELSQILRRAQAVESRSRNAFADGTDTYDAASMLIIRMAALIERPEFAHWAAFLTIDEINAIRTLRNIVAHAGYAAMNDDIVWNAVTVEVPQVVDRLLHA